MQTIRMAGLSARVVTLGDHTMVISVYDAVFDFDVIER